MNLYFEHILVSDAVVVDGGIITVVTLMVCSDDGSAGYFDGELGTRCRTGTAAVAA